MRDCPFDLFMQSENGRYRCPESDKGRIRPRSGQMGAIHGDGIRLRLHSDGLRGRKTT